MQPRLNKVFVFYWEVIKMKETLRKSMLKCLRKKDSQNLAKLLEGEGFDMSVDLEEVLKNYTEKINTAFKERKVPKKNIENKLLFYGIILDDLTDYTKIYSEGFVGQRNKDKTLEIVGYGVIKSILDPIRILFDPNPERKLRKPVYFFWHDVLEPQLPEQKTDPFAALKVFKATESKYHDLIKSDCKVKALMGIARYSLAYGLALKKGIKNSYHPLESKDLEKTLRVNAFFAPGNPTKCRLYAGRFGANPLFSFWPADRINTRRKIKDYLPNEGFFQTGVYGRKAVNALLS